MRSGTFKHPEGRATYPCRVRRVLVLTTAACIALGGCGEEDAIESALPPKSAIDRAYKGSPPALDSLHRQPNELLDGGRPAFERRIRGLRGHPVVVNKWASWCAPCRAEFPHFQRVSVKLGREVAFLAVNSNDNYGEAAEFLERFPVPYPSYKDGDERISPLLEFPRAFPVTAFFDRRGKLAYTHAGPYRTDESLIADIRRYGK